MADNFFSTIADTDVSKTTKRLTDSLALPIIAEDTTKEEVPWHLTDEIAHEDWAMANLFRWVNGGDDPVAVSYTHLRAHQT